MSLMFAQGTSSTRSPSSFVRAPFLNCTNASPFAGRDRLTPCVLFTSQAATNLKAHRSLRMVSGRLSTPYPLCSGWSPYVSTLSRHNPLMEVWWVPLDPLILYLAFSIEDGSRSSILLVMFFAAPVSQIVVDSEHAASPIVTSTFCSSISPITGKNGSALLGEMLGRLNDAARIGLAPVTPSGAAARNRGASIAMPMTSAYGLK